MATKSHGRAVLDAQFAALDELGAAYMDARDVAQKVLQVAFGEAPPCERAWPPPGITQSQADSRLLAVQGFLGRKKDDVEKVLRDVKETQHRLVASGFDVPRSWIIVHPLGKFPRLCRGSQVADVVRSALAQDTALEKVLEEIDVDMRLLEGQIAAVPSGPELPDSPGTAGDSTGGKPALPAASPRPAAKPGEGKGKGDLNLVLPDADAEKHHGNDEKKSRLKPSQLKAHSQWKTAIERNPELDGAIDEDVYKWVRDNLLDEDETLPSLGSWKRYVGAVRTARGESKHSSRAGRLHGKSIVRENEI